MEKAYVCNECGVVFEPKDDVVSDGGLKSTCPVCKKLVSIHRTELAKFGE